MRRRPSGCSVRRPSSRAAGDAEQVHGLPHQAREPAGTPRRRRARRAAARGRSKEELEARGTSAEVRRRRSRQAVERAVCRALPRQVSDTERTMGVLKDQHNGLQQALATREGARGDRGPPEEAVRSSSTAARWRSRASRRASPPQAGAALELSARRLPLKPEPENVPPVSATEVSLRRWRRRRESCGR